MTEPNLDTDEGPSDGKDGPGGGRRLRWPLGLLTLITVVVVAGGVWLLGGDDSSVDVPDLSGNPDAAPDFAIDIIGGSDFRLSEHLAQDGRPVVLNLWASWCNPCRAEMPAFDQAAKVHTDVYFLGVAVEDDPDAARAFADEIMVDYDLAIDEAERVGDRYPSPGLPATFLISSDGTLSRTIYGQVDEAEIDQLLEETFGR